MNKYQNNIYDMPKSELSKLLMEGENIIWSGKPKKKAYVINRCMTMMPMALIWLMIDGIFIFTLLQVGSQIEARMTLILIGFFAIHLFPVWLWIGNIITAGKRWENTEYAVTDKRIIIRNGLIGYEYQNIYYKEISDVHLHVGLIDKLLHVGDIMLCVPSVNVHNNHSHNAGIIDIENVEEVFKQVQKAVLDIQSDIEFPNAYRPDVNTGYNTSYRG